MDDPWGSPWADEHNNNPDAPLKVEVKPGAPAKVLLQESKETPSSPWGESDDGFGEWASMPADMLGPDGMSELGPSGYTWDVTDKKTDQGQTEALHGHSIPWTHTAVQDSGNETSKLSPRVPSQIAREPSPDPWATTPRNGSTARVGDVEEREVLDHGADSDDTVVQELLEVDASKQTSTTAKEEPSESAVEHSLGEQTAESLEPSDIIGKLTELAEDPKLTTQNQEIDHESTRSSTSPSE